MRSLQLGAGWFPEEGGGLERYFFEMRQALPEVGVSTSGLVIGSPQIKHSSGGDVTAFAQSTMRLPDRLRGLRRAVSTELATGSFDVVAGHFALYALPILQMVRELPLVFHFHGPWAAERRMEGGKWFKTTVQRTLERHVYHRAECLITLSDAFKQMLMTDYGIRENKIRVIPGGMDTDRYAISETRDEARQILGWQRDRPIVLAVRRLTRRMGLSELIASVEIIRRSVPDVLVLIAGRGILAGELESQIAAAGLKNHVQMLGFLPDSKLPLAYRAADITVVPSLALEGFGLSAAESLAAGTPALVTPVGGLPEVVRDLPAELVIVATGVNALAHRITAILKGTLPVPSAKECQEHCRRRFDWAVVGQKIRAVYAEACGSADVVPEEARLTRHAAVVDRDGETSEVIPGLS
ncbi:MAG: glycosyltransferase family 4 protein [Planctomycetota bacterium]|nr:glycosyltransferase family 4 protein [Planctomycetota bacterium]